jgi:Arc/MetJ-type ribon-helix-helix transcriptional regulator
MTNAITDNRKKRGRPKIGATLIGVRVEPSLLAVVDQMVGEVGVSRPDVLRLAFSEWAASHELTSGSPSLREVPVMTHLDRDVLSMLDAANENELGEPSRPEAIRRILRDWLTERGYLRLD